jgi:hypothetical protein
MSAFAIATMTPETPPAPVFARVDPDAICLSCLQIGDHRAGASAACRACGFDERVPPASPLHLPPRTILHGQYLLGRVLGQGGFGITYLAWDLNLDNAVALKEFLPTDFASRATGQSLVTPYGDDGRLNFDYGLDAFEAEARTLARCYILPGVVDVLTYFRENGTGYIVMHYMAGRTLREHLRQRGSPLPFDEAVTVMLPVLAALQEVHRLGLVHRDISPDNIYICDSGRVCLLDFGAARNAVRDRSKSLSVQFKEGYTPEEQYRRHGQQGPWTDVYAAAATMYRVMTGVAPTASLDRLTSDQLQPPSALGITLPKDAERALMRALAVQAEQRYQTIDAFLHDLTPGAPSPTLPPNATLARPPAGTGGALAAIVGIIADAARLARAKLDAALGRSGSGGAGGSAARERAIREQLATLWPVTLVSASLKDPHLPAGPEHGPLDVYARDETREVRFDAVLQNNFAGIRALHGTLGAAFVSPQGQSHIVDVPVPELSDRAAVAGAWGPPPPAQFDPGMWRIEFWWDRHKIGEHGFIISV